MVNTMCKCGHHLKDHFGGPALTYCFHLGCGCSHFQSIEETKMPIFDKYGKTMYIVFNESEDDIDKGYLDFWADAGKDKIIESVPGVAKIFVHGFSENKYSVALDPRYDRTTVMVRIVEAIKESDEKENDQKMVEEINEKERYDFHTMPSMDLRKIWETLQEYETSYVFSKSNLQKLIIAIRQQMVNRGYIKKEKNG